MASGNITRVNDDNFVDEVLKSDRPVLIDFFADWCGPCKAFAPTLQKYADAHPEVKVVKINVDDSPKSASGIKSIPTLVVVKDGKGGVIGQGNMPYSKMEEAVTKGIEFLDAQPNLPQGGEPKSPKGPQP
jgi:thioredoxin 1